MTKNKAVGYQHDLSSDNRGAIYNGDQLMRNRDGRCEHAQVRKGRLSGYQSGARARSQRLRLSNDLSLDYFYYDI